MKLLKGLAVAVLMAAVPMTGVAQEKKKDLNPWVDCGIGAMIFDETHWAAVSSNIIWDLGTTAVISNASSQNTCDSKRAKMAMYVGVNYASLTEEAAKGDGKHLHAMLDVMGCEAASHDAIIASVRTEFGQYLRAPGYVEKTQATKAEDFYNIVQGTLSGNYGQQCRV